MVKNPTANAGNMGLLSESGRFPGGRNGNPLHYSRLGSPMDRRAWQARVHGVKKSWMRLSIHIQMDFFQSQTAWIWMYQPCALGVASFLLWASVFSSAQWD